MAPKVYPETPELQSSGERQVLKQLTATLPDAAEIFCNYRFFDGEENREVDFIVLWPGAGVMFIEVKGGLVTLGTDGKWRNRTSPKDPYDQVTKAMHGVEKIVQDSGRLNRSLRATWMVVFPETALGRNVKVGNFSQDRIVDETALPDIKDRIYKHLHDLENATNSKNDLEIVSGVLTNEWQERDFFQWQWAAINNQRTKLTEVQQKSIEALKRQPKYVVSGPAGSGKTFMALNQARTHVKEGRVTALICYNEGLAQFFKVQVGSWPHAERPKFVGTFHSLLSDMWKVKIPSSGDNESWNLEAAIEAIKNLQSRELVRFEAFVIDEAQDFSSKWWEVLTFGYDSDKPGYLSAYGDENQNIYRQSIGDSFPDLYPVTVLTKNLRCTEPINEIANILMDTNIESSGLPGGPVGFVQCPTEFAHKGADETVDLMLNAGWPADKIMILTTNKRHGIQLELSDDGSNKDKYWRYFFDNESFFASNAYAFKGLEKPVVVIALDGWKPDARPRELLYTAITRATDKVVIVGDIDLIRKEFGDQFADRLWGNWLFEFDPSEEISAAEALGEDE